MASPARKIIKRLVPERQRSALRRMLREARLGRRAIRNGVSPASVIRYQVLGQADSLRFKGVRVRTTDPQATQDVARDIWSHGEYDIDGFLPEAGWRVVDIGGNVGLFAMHAASRGARVTSFEPHPEAARCFRANTARWDVALVEAAVVGAPSGPLRLFSNPDRDIRHTLLGRDVNTGEELTVAIEVPTIPIADVLDAECDLLKVDCEGGEFEIFPEDAGAALRNTKRIIAELHVNAGDPQEVVDAVRAAGFETALHESAHPGTPFVQMTAVRV